MENFKKYFLIVLLLELLLAYTPAFAQTQPAAYSGVSSQIETYLCSPNPTGSTQNTANPNAGVLYQCINQLYKFAIVVASVVGVLFIVVAGYVYMSAEGNTESLQKAKGILESTIVSLVILLGGYALLNTINPDLVQFHSIQPPSAGTVTTSNGTGNNNNGTPQGSCNGCLNLASAGIPASNASIIAAPNVISKLQSMKSQQVLAGVNWYVSSAYDYRASTNDCHNTGSCADISINPKSDSSWSSICVAAKSAGFSTILNEASNTASQCPTYQTYSSTDGANIHVVP